MFRVTVAKNQAMVTETEPMTSGSVAVYKIGFEFSSDWDGFDRFAVFDDGDARVEIPLDETNVCNVPWEVMTDPDDIVEVGVYGVRDNQILPTVWVEIGTIEEGVLRGDDPQPVPDIWQEQLATKQNKLIGEPGQVVGFNDAGEAIAQDNTGGGGSGTQGPPGPAGANGKSAYEIAVENGFKGNETEWLASLQGPPGKDGESGEPGPKGDPGDTPYVGENGNWWIGGTDTGAIAMGSSENIYSTEEIRIGRWIDGKPLYRRVVIVQKVTSDTTLFSDTSDWEIDAIVRLDGVFYNIVSANPNSSDSEEPIVHFYNANNYGAIFVEGRYNKIYGRNVGRISCSARVYVEYTKSTDSAAVTIAQSVPLMNTTAVSAGGEIM